MATAPSFFCGFFFVRFDIVCWIGTDEDVVHHSPQHRVAVVGEFPLQHQLHQFFGGGHILKVLSKGNHCESHVFHVLHHLHRTPAVKGNLTDVEPLTQLFEEFLNVALTYYVALCNHQRPLAFPQVVGNMVAPDTKIQRFLRYPEVGQA